MLPGSVHFATRGTLPRHNGRDVAHVFQSRTSLYCVHREVLTLQGASVSKSCLVAFRHRKHAERVRKVMMEYQREGRVIDGLVEADGSMQLVATRGRPMLPLDITAGRMDDLERECLMNYFDLWLVVDVDVKAEGDNRCSTDAQKTMESLQSLQSLRLDVYEYVSTEPPSRSMVNHQLERLLRG
jgi:hypothetical protein